MYLLYSARINLKLRRVSHRWLFFVLMACATFPQVRPSHLSDGKETKECLKTKRSGIRLLTCILTTSICGYWQSSLISQVGDLIQYKTGEPLSCSIDFSNRQLVCPEAFFSAHGGMGNGLTRYFYLVAIADRHNYTFVMEEPVSYSQHLIASLPKKIIPRKRETPQSFTNPSYACKDILSAFLNNTQETHIDYSLVKYPHASDTLYCFYNRHFLPTIVQSTGIALNSFFKKNVEKRIVHFESNCDLTLHIRCGDTFQHPKRIFMTSRYYDEVIPTLLSKKNRSYCLNPHDTHKKNIWLLTQRSVEKIRRFSDIWGRSTCKKILRLMEDYFTKKLPGYTVKTIGDGLENDFYTMVKAPQLICGDSTLCLMAAMANEGSSALPQSSHVQWHIDTNASLFLPENHLIVPMNPAFFVTTAAIKEDPKFGVLK